MLACDWTVPYVLLLVPGLVAVLACDRTGVLLLVSGLNHCSLGYSCLHRYLVLLLTPATSFCPPFFRLLLLFALFSLLCSPRFALLASALCFTYGFCFGSMLPLLTPLLAQLFALLLLLT